MGKLLIIFFTGNLPVHLLLTLRFHLFKNLQQSSQPELYPEKIVNLIQLLFIRPSI